MNEAILQVKGLRTYFFTYRGTVRAVDGVGFCVRRGETVALVGESGCGKSATALSVMRLIPHPGRIVDGTVEFDGEDLLTRPQSDMQQIRGGRIGMIFQEPLTALNPTLTVGSQLVETLKVHGVARGRAAREGAIALFETMGIPAARERFRSYPHELSGGMRQRVMIAIAVACGPELLIADEPTTALDVTLQAQIMDLLAQLKEERGLAVVLITHDLGIVAQFAERAAVMYAGQIVEEGSVSDIIADPLHPYTQGLLRCVPHLGRPDLKIEPIEGVVPDLIFLPMGCRFAPRCPQVMDVCRREPPSLLAHGEGRMVRCYLYEEEVYEEKVYEEKAQ